MNEKEWIAKLKNEGFKDIRVCPVEPTSEFGEHSHDEHTVHVILKGELHVKDKTGKKTMKEGDYFEFPASTTHSTKTGPHGVTFIVAVRK